jgi:hypothetical protein
MKLFTLFDYRWMLSGVMMLCAVSAHAERIPIILSPESISDLGPNTNVQFTAVQPDTLTVRSLQDNFPNPPISFSEFALTNLVPDAIDRMLNYEVGDPPSYEWTFTEANASTFGLNWLEFQNQLNESKPGDAEVTFRFFSSAPLSGSNPTASGSDSITEFLRREGVPRASEKFVNGFDLHEIKVYVDYYFWHDILEGLRGVQIRTEIRGDADVHIIPEPATFPILSFGLALIGLVARRSARDCPEPRFPTIMSA